jgi:hypothetical protein
MWAVYCGDVRGEVGMRSHMWYVGWAVWVQGVLLLYAKSRSTVSSYVCKNYMHIYTSLINIQHAILYNYSFNCYSGFIDLILYKYIFYSYSCFIEIITLFLYLLV